MAESLIYKNPYLYLLSMRVLYGRHYWSRCQEVADLIPSKATVLDVCCGPAQLYHDHLRFKEVRYKGLDINRRFINQLVRQGAEGQVWDLTKNDPLPPADYVVMQASLYQFLPDAAAIVDRMLQAAGEQVIVAEPVRNLSLSRIPIVPFVARHLTNPGNGSQSHRFTEEMLDKFFSAYQSQIDRSFLIAGHREKIYVLNKRSCS